MMGVDRCHKCRALCVYWPVGVADRWDRNEACLFPRALIQFIGLKGRATHYLGRRGLVHVGLDALPQGIELFPGQP
jgi:hypothetical protein